MGSKWRRFIEPVDGYIHGSRVRKRLRSGEASIRPRDTADASPAAAVGLLQHVPLGVHLKKKNALLMNDECCAS